MILAPINDRAIAVSPPTLPNPWIATKKPPTGTFMTARDFPTRKATPTPVPSLPPPDPPRETGFPVTTAGETWPIFFEAEDGIRDYKVSVVQTCALPISRRTTACSFCCWPRSRPHYMGGGLGVSQRAVLLISQRHGRVHLKRPAGWEVAGNQGNRGEKHRESAKGRRIPHANAEQQIGSAGESQRRSQHAGHHGCARQTGCPADEHGPHSLAHNQAQHSAATGAQRHADADLPDPLADKIGHHAVDPHHSQSHS